MTCCKRPGCNLEAIPSERGAALDYCGRYCRNAHGYQQDAQALYDALRECMLPLDPRMPELIHSYDAEDAL